MWGLAGVRCLRPERAYSRLLGIRRPWLLAYVCVDCVRSFIFMSAVDLHIWRQMTWSGPKNTVRACVEGIFLRVLRRKRACAS